METVEAPAESGARPPHSCGGKNCTARWTGLGIAHCGSCHRTFSAVSRFDIHRDRGRCLDPADLAGFALDAHGVWGIPTQS